MTKLLLKTTAVSILLGISTAALAISVTGNATAIIKKALTATQVTPMNYGTIGVPTAGGTVTISPAGNVSTSATGFNFSGSPTAGSFTITGEPSTSLTISFQNGSLTGAGTAMTLNNFTSTPAAGSVTTNTSGSVTLNVGADLVVGASQASGTYTGTYQLTVSY